MSQRLLSSREVVWVAAGLLAGLVPHMQRFPLLLSLAFIGAALWRVLGARGLMPLPERAHPSLWIAKQFVAVAAFVSIYIAYRGQLGREAGVELLAALLGLKLLEMRSERDYYVVAFLCYFLVVTNFFYSQTMGTAIYMLALVVYITAVLVQFNTPPDYRSTPTMFRLAGTMVVQAMPIMIIAFVLFPRLPGPLWGLPQDAFDGITGLSDELRLGEIARLGFSDEIAFRVEFHGDAPRARDRYWRGPVLWHTDGVTWTKARHSQTGDYKLERLGPSYNYTITLEPHRERWLLGLDAVTTAEPPALHAADGRLFMAKKARRRLAYSLTSAVDYRLTGLPAESRRAALQLPKVRHPRARELAEQWAALDPQPLAIAGRALDYFRLQPFRYSLTPPRLSGDRIDAFLFETREGFCEHFAASFVVLMRAAGVPARIVTGYQGGEYNSVASYLIIRQREAHAWAEIYDETQGWVRVDPTAAVVPERVSLGIETLAPRRRGIAGIAGDGVASAVIERLRDSFDAVTYSWNQWVLGYTSQQQQRFLRDLGFDDVDYGSLIIALTLWLAGATGVLALIMLRAARRDFDPASAAWRELSRKLARIGLGREPAEAPHAYANRVATARADLAAEVSAIARLYIRQRYARNPGESKSLMQRVRRLRVPRSR